MNSKGLLYSKGTIFNIQYPLIIHNGKESEKNCTHIKLNHFAVYLKLTQHCKLTTLKFFLMVKKK